MAISQNELARALKVPPRRINEIVHAKRGITVDTALRLSRHFGISVRFWLGLQDDYDLDVAEDSQMVERINREVRPRAVATKYQRRLTAEAHSLLCGDIFRSWSRLLP